MSEQIGFLESSIAGYDLGNTDEAKRIALILRILLHDSKYSNSLLSQLGMKDRLFCDSSKFEEYNKTPWDVIEYIGLIGLLLSPDQNIIEFAPFLDKTAIRSKMIKFNDWWTMTVIKDTLDNTFSRKDIVLTMADQDGGAHVDPVILDNYAAISRENSLGITGHIGQNSPRPILYPERATVRQIAHEVMKSLFPDYAKSLVLRPGSGFVPTPTFYTEAKKVSSKDPCPCGSGIRYKHCHGR